MAPNRSGNHSSKILAKKPSLHDKIPPELLPEVTLHLTGNAPALKSLSLVSRLWMPAAQKYLFANITVRSEGSPGKNDNPDDLLAFLQNNPHLASYVTHLTLCEERAREHRAKWDKLLCEFLPLFPNVRRLSLAWAQGAWWPRSCAPSLESTLQCFDALNAILQSPKLVHVDFTRVPISWTQFLSSSVKNLGIWEPYLDRQLDTAAPNEINSDYQGPLSHIQLNILLIDGVDWASCYQVGDAIKWLLQAGLDVSNLRKLSLGLISAPYKAHEDVMVLLEACAGTLRELSITPSFASYSPARDDYTDILDLSILRKLRILHIGAQAGIVHNEIDIEPMLWLIPQLKRFPARNRLQEIVFACEYTVYETVHNNAYFGLNFDSYAELDSQVLTPARFPKLKHFTNYIENPNGVPVRNLILWILKSLLPRTLNMRQRKVFLDRFGGVWRKTMFPANAPWY